MGLDITPIDFRYDPLCFQRIQKHDFDIVLVFNGAGLNPDQFNNFLEKHKQKPKALLWNMEYIQGALDNHEVYLQVKL